MARLANGVPVKTRLPAAAWILAAIVAFASLAASFVADGHVAQDVLLALADHGLSQAGSVMARQ
jgi:hypothetical protein